MSAYKQFTVYAHKKNEKFYVHFMSLYCSLWEEVEKL